ncbi:MAG TPA: carboxypeptidase-like regulatory domain-containing protein, partial [Blastocatellia bacterium]|nr:carboxypeptidase-like regulatory domain-containing protein [Blastocatellia bacterium]
MAGPVSSDPSFVSTSLQRSRVEGTVTDPTGGRVAAAQVILRDNSGKDVARTQTDAEGRFSFSDVPEGRYTVSVEAVGFAQPTSPTIEVRAGKTESVSIKLEVAAITERLDVSATDPVYTQLRSIKLSGESAAVNTLSLKRDSATITFKEGQLYFLAPVEGRVTGAVFIGSGEFSLTPVFALEQKHLGILTGGPSINEQFSKMVLRFTDSTYDEIKKQAEIKPGEMSSSAQDALNDNRNALRKGRNTRFNLDARILVDLLWPGQVGLFQAFFNGKRYGDLLYGMDPLGSPFVTPEEVVLVAFSEGNLGIWVATHLADHYKTPSVFNENHQLIDLTHHKIEATVKSKRLDARVQTRFKALVDGSRVIPFELYPTLRVKKVIDDMGRELRFIQEKKEEDADFFVILQEGLKKG